MTRRTSIMLTAATIVSLGLARGAEANTATTAAAEAFSRAQAATLEGDHARAAELYDLAHQLVPSPEALRSAARSHYAAGHIGVAATRAEALLVDFADDARSRALAEALLARVRDRVTRVYLTCAPSCTVAVDGAAAVFADRSQHTLYVTPGRHEFTATFPSGADESRAERGEAGGELGLAFTEPERRTIERDEPAPEEPAPAPEEPQPPPTATPAPALAAPAFAGERDRGPSPRRRAAVSALATATVALAATTTWSAVDTARGSAARRALSPAEAHDESTRLGLRTGLLGAATLAGLAATWLVHASGDDERERAPSTCPCPPAWGVSAERGGVSLSVGGSF